MPKGIYVRTLKTRQALGRAHKGRKLTPEHIAKIANANRGRHHTDEAKIKMSQTPRRQYGPLTMEHRMKISASSKGRICSEETRRKMSIAAAKHPGNNRFDRHLRKEYGINEDNYNELVIKQENKCAICHKPETGTRKGVAIKRLSVDHDHITGKVRGLLCNVCNKSLGGFNDSVELLANAIKYLNKDAL